MKSSKEKDIYLISKKTSEENRKNKRQGVQKKKLIDAQYESNINILLLKNLSHEKII